VSGPSSEAIFAALWARVLHDASDRDVADPAGLLRLARQTGVEAVGCIASATVQDGAALVRSSASLLYAVTLLWAAAGVEPDEIWMELHKRERLGSLLHQMTTGEGRPKRRLGQPWRVDSTKLP
jgi:phosphoribosyl-ATP pyrophosphohydrolase